MDLLIDTQALVWIASKPALLPHRVRSIIEDSRTCCFVSAVTAYEYVDLNARGRFERDMPLQPIVEQLAATILDYPSDAWRLIEALPRLHRDPVDRMLIAHAIHAGLTLVTADATIRRYPLATFW